MGRLYEEFEENRKTLDEQTRIRVERLNAASASGVEGYRQVAKEEMIEICKKSPLGYFKPLEVLDVDPIGKHSAQEIELARRLEAVKHSGAGFHSDVQELVYLIETAATTAYRREEARLGDEPRREKALRDLEQFGPTWVSEIHQMHPITTEGGGEVGNQAHRTEQEKLQSLKNSYRVMREMSTLTQSCEMMAMLCHDETLSEQYEGWMEESAKSVLGCPFGKLIECAEYAAGIREELPQEVNDKHEMKKLLEEIGYNAETLQQIHEEALGYENPYFGEAKFSPIPTEHLAKHQQLLDPKNWDTPYRDLSSDFADEVTAERVLGSHLTLTAKNELDPLFRKFEEAHPDFGKVNRQNRAKLIIVGDRTVEEVMRQEHLEKQMQMKQKNSDRLESFSDYFARNYEKDTNRIVAAAMATDKRVEIFVPDKDGNVTTPIQMVKEGEYPTQVQPVAYNAWHKFASHFGFYKEKTQQQKEYETLMSKRAEVQREAQGQVRVTKTMDLIDKYAQNSDMHSESKSSYVDENQMDRLENVESKIGFSYSRTVIPTICAGKLMGDGHSVEDIRNPNALINEKRAIGNEFVARCEAKDSQWLAQTIYNGQLEYKKFLDEHLVDIHTLENHPRLEDVLMVSGMIYDSYQERGRVPVNEAFETIQRQRAEIDGNVEDKLLDIAHGLKAKREAVIATKAILDETDQTFNANKDDFQFNIIFRETVFSKMNEKGRNIQQPISETILSGETCLDLKSKMLNDRVVNLVQEDCVKDPKIFAYVQDQLKQDKLIDDFKVDIAKKPNSNLIEMKVGLKDGPLKTLMIAAERRNKIAEKEKESKVEQKNKTL